MTESKGTAPLVVSNLYEAAAIQEISGQTPELSTDPSGWTFFSFPPTPSVLEAERAFHSGQASSLSGYVRSLRRLRGLMMAARGGAI